MKKIVLSMHTDKIKPEMISKWKNYLQHWNLLKKGLEKHNWRERISGNCLCENECVCYGCKTSKVCHCGKPLNYSFWISK